MKSKLKIFLFILSAAIFAVIISDCLDNYAENTTLKQDFA